jgi:hypothetical protein
MFQALTSKVFSGLVGLSILLLSSYKGNDARFDNFQAFFTGEGVRLELQLVDAFTNDFEDIFKSGKAITVHFDLKVKDDDAIVFLASFAHTVQYDPMSQEYTLTCEDRHMENIIVTSYNTMVEELSRVEYFLAGDLPRVITLELESSLEKMKLESLDKEYDMMILWKYKRPRLEMQLDKAQYEN